MSLSQAVKDRISELMEITFDEKNEIEPYTGEIEQCTFTDFIRETPFEGEFDDFTKD